MDECLPVGYIQALQHTEATGANPHRVYSLQDGGQVPVVVKQVSLQLSLYRSQQHLERCLQSYKAEEQFYRRFAKELVKVRPLHVTYLS